jgi:hypothetical protein
MRRVPSFSSVAVLAAVLGLGLGVGCSTSEDEIEAQELAARHERLKACGIHDLDPKDHDTRACEPGNTKKTTICHVPPGNPANAHTLCIGNAAVKHHLKNHPDYLGPCKVETTCPPPADAGAPAPTPDSGAGGTGGAPGTGGAGGAGGAGGEEIIQ